MSLVRTEMRLKCLWSYKLFDASLFYKGWCLEQLGQSKLLLTVKVERLIKDLLWLHGNVPP